MPNRIIKESICYSESLDKLSPFEETVFYRLIVNVDDFGRTDARPGYLKSKLFVTKQGVTEKNVSDALQKMASIGLVRLYEVDGKSFLLFSKWSSHQQRRANNSKWPAPADESRRMITSEINGNHLLADAPVFEESRNREARIEESRSESDCAREETAPDGAITPTVAQASRLFKPPSADEVRGYCAERNNGIDAEQFVDFYAAKGWKIGKEPMKDWRAAVRTWEKRDGRDKHARDPSNGGCGGAAGEPGGWGNVGLTV